MNKAAHKILPLLLFFVGPARAEVASFDLGDAKAILIQMKEAQELPQQENPIATRCQSNIGACYRILKGDPESLTTKLQEIRKLYSITLSDCPGNDGSIGIQIFPIHISEGDEQDSDWYEVLDRSTSSTRISELEAQGFKVATKCDDGGSNMPVVIDVVPSVRE